MIQFVLIFTEQIRKNRETDAFRKLAFTDAMTGLGNRAAYMQCESELEKEFSSHRTKKMEHGVPLTIATGNYLFDGRTGRTIERAERLADRSMYEHKAEMKGKTHSEEAQ